MAMQENDFLITYIMPCFNEEDFIKTAIESILNQDYRGDYELLVIDGLSTDNTYSCIESFVQDSKNIKLLTNKNRTKPYALNIGIKESKGKYILILDAHSNYPPNYTSTLIKSIESNPDVINVGCPFNTLPSRNNSKAKAIALAMSSPLGVGTSRHRIGSDREIYTDSVPYGCFRREAFEKYGLFDEELTRNQDDEMNGRLIKNNEKILMITDIKIDYYTRNSFLKLHKMFYQYGLFKPLVNKKLGSPATIRQFAPPILVISLPVSIFLYLPFLVLTFMISSLKTKSILIGLYFSLSILIMQISYGTGYLIGIKRLLLNQSFKVVQHNR